MPVNQTDQTTEELWRKYSYDKSPDAKEAIILRYASLVKYVAGRVAISLPANVEFDDLVSYGIFGLIDAIDKFDFRRGLKFETYAIARIRGSILDELRKNDWIPRSVRQKAKELERTYVELENRLGRSVTDQEMSEALNLSIRDFRHLLSEVSCTTLNSLDELWMTHSGDEETVRLLDLIHSNENDDPLFQLEIEEIKLSLATAIDNLPEREKMVIALYYYNGLTLKEISQVMEVSESRISQIHTNAIYKLRVHLTQGVQSIVKV